ncbi:uncharacterized protein N7500_000799 [Penicillium coprophilum]|uniref:uncharacterized protein n=1 Tax=Penicillium coprophilum TaxID=36646 RepID=UPI00239EE078|nr:uncharacterized protein N7500_000799 [Penicillium coprophilum]KAJ5178100.1 hypothetical protein N7500_000799 [Penicillium coprophilum]
MFSASSLLCMGTWAAVILQATAVPHGPSYKKPRADEDPCGPVAKYTENRTLEKWNKAGTDDWLEKWWTVNAEKRESSSFGFAGAFGQYALGESEWSCQNTGSNTNCDLSPCKQAKLNSLGNNTESAYYVLQSLVNLHGFFLGLEESFNIAAVVSALENDELVTNFWHDEKMSVAYSRAGRGSTIQDYIRIKHGIRWSP